MCEQFHWQHICNLDVGAAAVNSSQLLVALLAMRFTKDMYVTRYMPCLCLYGSHLYIGQGLDTFCTGTVVVNKALLEFSQRD